MKILVIGKNGQLGQELMSRAKILGIDAQGVTHEDCDITKPDQVAAIINKCSPEAVINATAYNLVQEAETDIEPAFAVNAFAVFELAKLCAEKNIKFVTVSTDYVFDGMKGSPYIESDIPNPLQVYGLSKFAGEILVRNGNADALIVRTCGVYGGKTGSQAKKGNFILYILKEAENKSELEVNSIRMVNPTFARHLALAILQLLEKGAPGGVYHLANTGACSWAQFAEEIVSIRGLNMKIVPVDRGDIGPAKFPLFSVLDNTEAKRLGIELPSWREGLKEYLDSLESLS